MRQAVGIHITDAAISLVEMGLRGKRPKVLKAGSEPLPEGVVSEGWIKDENRLSERLLSLVQRLKVKARNAYLLVPGEQCMLRFISLPAVDDKELRKLVDFEVRNNIYLPFERPVYDYYRIPASANANHGGTIAEREQQQCQVTVAAAPQDLVQAYAAAVKKAGLRAFSVEIKALALLRYVTYIRRGSGSLPETFLCLDANEGLVDVHIYHGGVLRFSRNIPPHAEEIPEEVEKLRDFFRYTLNHREQEIDQIFISGDQQGLLELADLLSIRLRADAEVLGLFLPGSSVEESAGYTVAAGLALKGVMAGGN